ncbi:hypothetical protein [Tenacibaculum maritimum]|uniref:hypothetical protein n=1 Tax=Tenacibaculum maritimum TaxID=107401 RepID=UPI001F41E5EC|nr:hypothetical protein [Tenacibaculum maritimum]
MITGTINCNDSYLDKKYKLRTNFTDFSTSYNTQLNQSIVENNFPDEVKLKDLNIFFRRARFNRDFYSSIEPELIKCLIANEKENYFESFFYLYRILEGISYTIPLIYVSKNKNYDKTFRQLQSFFGKDKDGELLFFRKFISATFKDEDFYNSSYTVDFNTIEIEELKSKYYEIYLKRINEKCIVDSTEDEKIDISFIGLYDFIIEMRNRYFHLKKGSWQDNISSTNVLYPDFFFKPVIKKAINWVGIVLFEIIKLDYEKGKS